MDTLLTAFLLFIAAISALLTYLIVPRLPVVALSGAAAVALAAGVWYHWTQFSVEYRTSTWQEQLRNYASYVMVLVVILLSYAAYVLGWSGVSDYAGRAASAVRNVGSQAQNLVSARTSSNRNSGFNLGLLNGNRNRNRNVAAGGEEADDNFGMLE
jgi:NADH:ubiquinone oxidoreductase subunit 6 (subunit J)